MHRLYQPVGLAIFAALLTTSAWAAADTRLADAAQAGDSRALVGLLNRRAVEAASPQIDGTTALHWAANNNDLQTAERLLRAGAKPDAANRYGITPLMLAAAHGGGTGVVRLLLEAGADPASATPEGETALMMAARAGDTAAVRALLAKGAPVYAAEGWRGQTALMWAAAENHPETVKALLAAGADLRAKSQAGFTPLLFAVRAGHKDMVKLLLDRGANVNDAMGNGTAALSLAALNSHWELGIYLLERGANPNADGQGWTAMHQAVISRSPHHENVNPQRIPTGGKDSLDFFRALVAHGADINKRMTRANIDTFRQWIQRDGATAFFLAAKAADVPLMRLLVEMGADPLIPTNAKVTPLAAAAGVGYCQGESPGTDAEALEAVKYALSLGGDVNATDDNGFTPMHGVAARGANDVGQYLYEQGARLTDKTKTEGWTPLDMADGVFIANTFKRQLHTAEFLRGLIARQATQRS